MNTDSRTIDKVVRISMFIIIGIIVVIPLYKKIEPYILSYLELEKTSGLEMDGIITATIALIGIVFIYNQIQQKNKETRLNNLTNRTISAFYNILNNGIKEGYFARDIRNNIRYVVCWRIDHLKNSSIGTESYQFNVIFRIVNKIDNFDSVLEDLCNTNNRKRWSFRAAIPYQNGHYGELILASNLGRGIEKLTDYEYLCIMHALLSVQLFNQSKLDECQNILRKHLKKANDAYLKTSITELPARYSGAT